jgi:hypothetical protein
MTGCLLILCSAIRAQDTLTSGTVEDRSSVFYSQGDWDNLISFCNKAIGKGFDYYYLRYRVGVAYYNKKEYRIAEKHFEKAIAFNSTDEAEEYLYFCYIYSGQFDQARWLSKSFSPDAASYTGTNKRKVLSFATLEGGIGSSDSSAKFQNEYYVQASLGHYVANRFSLFHAITYFSQNAFRGPIQQIAYYLGADIPLKKDWSLITGVQPISFDQTPKYVTVDSVIAAPPLKKGLRPPRKPEYNDSSGATKTYFNFVWAVTLVKSFSLFDITIGSAIATIDTTTQYEHYLGLTCFPLRNNKFSFGATGYMHTENHYASVHYAIVPYINITPIKPLNLTISYLSNSGGNIVEDNGYLVTSTPDPMVARLSFLATIAVSNSVNIYGVYQQQDNLEYHKHWPFYYNLFVIGIKYIPQ